MCVNFIYDLNGSKGPNTVGKDIGVMTVFNSMDSIVVAPMPSSASDAGQAIWENATKLCNNDESERLPNIDELSSLFINKDIVNLTPGVMSWSGSPYSSSRAWGVNTGTGFRVARNKTVNCYVRCVKR